MTKKQFEQFKKEVYEKCEEHMKEFGKLKPLAYWWGYAESYIGVYKTTLNAKQMNWLFNTIIK